MVLSADDEDLKGKVREYWNQNPCGTQFTDLELGSKEFFAEVERFRYASQPFMREQMEFDAFRGKKLLEIGCGLGTDLLQFARGGALVTGVDLTPKSIELVLKRFAMEGLPVDARVADAERLPFADETFDVVYSFGVLHHTPDTSKAVSEVHRVLKPGGRIIVMLYHTRSAHVRLGTIYAHLSAGLRNRINGTEDWVRVYDGEGNPLGKSYTRNEVRSMFARFGDLRLKTVDPLRRGIPPFANAVNQALFAWWWGFWLVIKGTREKG